MARGKIANMLIEMVEKSTAKPDLDMSEAARMARAEEMGFFPNTLYHGTSYSKTGGVDFDEFQKFEGEDMSRSVSRSPVGKLGISLAEQPKVAEDFAYQASPASGEGAAMMPLKFRADKIASIKLAGDETNDEIYGTVVDAWKQGFDAIQFKNYTTPAGTKGSFVLVKEPNQIRSVSAKFDPAKKESGNLMAGALPTGAVGAGALLAGGLTPQESFAQERTPTLAGLSQQPSMPRDVGSIRAPSNQTASDFMAFAEKYNAERKKHPLADMLLPVGELPAELWMKRAYGDKVKISDYLKAAIGAL